MKLKKKKKMNDKYLYIVAGIIILLIDIKKTISLINDEKLLK